MNSHMKLLLPGIDALFGALGWKARLTDTDGLLVVSIKKGTDVQSRTYPYPQTNEELSTPLRAWRDELMGVGV